MKPNPLTVGLRIKSIRETRGVNQKEFAKLINATVPAVSNWENGRSLPNNERLKKIAEIGNLSINELLYGSIENFRYTLINKLYEESVINGGLEERSPKTFEYIGGEKFVNEVYEKVTELNLGYEDTENIKKQFDNMYSRKLMAYSNILSKDTNVKNHVTNLINEDEFHEQGNPIHESALKDTITCFEDCDSDIDDSDLAAIYLNNINYYENETDYRIYDKNSYIAYLELRIKAFEKQLEKSELPRTAISVFKNSIKIDERTIQQLK